MNINRKDKYLTYFEAIKVANWKQLSQVVSVSEPTIRRDMKMLEDEGLIKIGSGGIQIIQQNIDTILASRRKINSKAKEAIAKKAASLIKDNEKIFIDAGSTTELIIPNIKAKGICIITNGLNIAQLALKNNFEIIFLGGLIKHSTLASIGNNLEMQLHDLYFVKSFLGANGASKENGYSTPDIREANIKKIVISKSKQAYILIDDSKFDNSMLVKFSEFSDVKVITNKIPKKYRDIIKYDIHNNF